MKSALCVFPIQGDIHTSVSKMKDYILEAANQNCDLIVFPEACLTGIDLSSNYEKDSKLGLNIDADEIMSIRQMAKDSEIYIAFGWLEIEQQKLYDSALLINDEGEILIHHRRMSRGWIDFNANSKLYCCGVDIELCQTKFGKISFLICGDLFTEGISEKTIAAKPDIVIYIMARSFANNADIQKQWDTIELPHYRDKWKGLDGTVLITNLLEIMDLDCVDIYCGGAYVLDGHGHILASKPLLEAGLLIYPI